MKSNLETQKIDAIKLANSFGVEELEERVEFGKWSVEPTEPKGGGTCSGGDCSGKIEGVGVKITPR